MSETVIVIEGDSVLVLGLQAIFEDAVAASHVYGIPLSRGTQVVDAARLA